MPRHAPSGTTLEVPDPDEGMEDGQRKYQIQLLSQNGPVDIYLVNAPPGGQVRVGTEANAWLGPMRRASWFVVLRLSLALLFVC
jgi:hypothetical protein